MNALLAHQGGWDELLLTAVLVLAMLGLSRLRRRPAGRPSLRPAPSPSGPAPKDVCAFCGAALTTDVRCPSCGFRTGSTPEGR